MKKKLFIYCLALMFPLSMNLGLASSVNYNDYQVKSTLGDVHKCQKNTTKFRNLSMRILNKLKNSEDNIDSSTKRQAELKAEIYLNYMQIHHFYQNNCKQIILGSIFLYPGAIKLRNYLRNKKTYNIIHTFIIEKDGDLLAAALKKIPYENRKLAIKLLSNYLKNDLSQDHSIRNKILKTWTEEIRQYQIEYLNNLYNKIEEKTKKEDKNYDGNDEDDDNNEADSISTQSDSGDLNCFLLCSDLKFGTREYQQSPSGTEKTLNQNDSCCDFFGNCDYKSDCCCSCDDCCCSCDDCNCDDDCDCDD